VVENFEDMLPKIILKGDSEISVIDREQILEIGRVADIWDQDMEF
jgi:hypothetical protein